MALPPAGVLTKACELSIAQDKPVFFDYYHDSVEKKCCIAVQDDDSKCILKSEDEYTSPIEHVYKTDGHYIVITSNSIYVLISSVPVKKVITPKSDE